MSTDPTLTNSITLPSPKYYISPMETLGIQTHAGFCTKHVIADETGPIIPYTVPDVNGAYFSTNLKGVMIAPNLKSAYGSMVMSDWLLSGGPWATTDIGTTSPLASIMTAFGPGDDNNVIFTLVNSGQSTATITYLDPHATNATLAITVDGLNICISLATNSMGAITTTAKQIATLITDTPEASAICHAIVEPLFYNSSDGEGTVLAMPAITFSEKLTYTHLVAQSTDTSVVSEAEFVGNYTANPTLMISLQRTELSTDFSAEKYTMKFGGENFSLTWNGTSRYVTLTYPGVVRDAITGKIVSTQMTTTRFNVKESDGKAFYMEPNLMFQIQSVGAVPSTYTIPGEPSSAVSHISAGQVWITCSAWGNEPWIINDVVSNYGVVIPQGKFTIIGQGSQWWFNINQLQYSTSASFSTTPLLTQQSVVLSDMVMPSTLVGRNMQWAIWGTGCYVTYTNSSWLDGGATSIGNVPLWYGTPECSATVVLTDATTGIFTINMSGDGYHTPIIQRWQAWFDPIYALPNVPTIIDITDYVIIGSPEEHLTIENSPNSMKLAINNYQRCYEIYINANTPDRLKTGGVSNLLRGEILLHVDSGWQTQNAYIDGTFDYTDIVPNAKMICICQQPDSVDPVAGQHTRELTGYDCLSLISNTRLLTAPCYLGASFDYALRSVLAWGGINPVWFEPNSEFVTTNGAGQTLNYSLDDPLRDYYSAPFDPEFGVNVLDFYRQICEQGVRAELQAMPYSDTADTLPEGWAGTDPNLPLPIVRFRWDVDSKLSLSSGISFIAGAVTGTQIAMADTKASMNIVGKPNLIVVVGRSVDGLQVIATAPRVPIDIDGTWLHSNAVKIQAMHKPDLITYAACERVAAWYWYTLLRPRLTVSVHTVDVNTAMLLPRQVCNITFADNMAGDYSESSKLYKISDIVVKHGVDTYHVDFQAQDLWVLPPDLVN